MKISIRLALGTILSLLLINAYSQTPQGINYQGLALDAGSAVKDKTIAVRLSILKDNPEGVVEYSETHSVKTNSIGVFSLVIGKGTIISGAFSKIDWGKGSKYLKSEIDITGGTTYTLVGNSSLVSVPYALYAQDVKNADKDTTNEIQTLSRLNDEIFLSKNGGKVNIKEVDGDPKNEIQTLTLKGDTILLSDGGFIKIPFNKYTGSNSAGTITSYQEFDQNFKSVTKLKGSSSWLAIAKKHDFFAIRNGNVIELYQLPGTLKYSLDLSFLAPYVGFYFQPFCSLDTEGNLYLSFSTNNSNSNIIVGGINIESGSRAHLLKYDISGSLAYQKSSSVNFSIPANILNDPSNNLILWGIAQGTNPVSIFGQSFSNESIFLIKFNSSGAFVAKRELTNTNPGNGYSSFDINTLFDGSLIVPNQFDGTLNKISPDFSTVTNIFTQQPELSFSLRANVYDPNYFYVYYNSTVTPVTIQNKVFQTGEGILQLDVNGQLVNGIECGRLSTLNVNELGFYFIAPDNDTKFDDKLIKIRNLPGVVVLDTNFSVKKIFSSPAPYGGLSYTSEIIYSQSLTKAFFLLSISDNFYNRGQKYSGGIYVFELD